MAFIKKHKLLTAFFGVTLALLITLGTVFLVRANHYKTHFFPGTVMSGVDVSELTAEEANEKVSRFVADYLLTIYARDDQKYYIEGPSIGYSYMPNGEIEQILERQDAYDWIKQRKDTKEQEIDLATTFDQQQLEKELAALPCMQTDQMVAPEDAKIAWVDDSYQLVPEVMGTTLKSDEVLRLVTQAVENGDTSVELYDHYVDPEIRSDDPQLNACMDNIEKYYGTSITYTFGNEEPFELTSEMIQAWLAVDEDYQVRVDDEKVTNFVQQMASKYNTYGDVRDFKTSLGDKVKIGGGDYGWVIDKDKEKAQIYEDLAKGGQIEREPVYQQVAKDYGAYDIGSTYVEIDYTNQHLWYYDKGNLVVDTDIVSGNLSRWNGSPDGIYKIVYKQRNATLVGEGYSSPVDYFMPFAYNVGIHDASWRNKFGEQIYLTAGSHGCINVPPAIAEKLYETLAVDTPVIAYYREKVYLTAENARISNAYSYISEDDYKELLKEDPTAVNPRPTKTNG
ncbi:MAG: peptidoglycan binding domain-containing protein [Lachnospiraceae bacterium]|nr:peptidoglycan binding domain-containing protein [bacterium]MDY5517393.1 peptidoglycan binding domain-containing protein [Lachnospiraceae bacterium]